MEENNQSSNTPPVQSLRLPKSLTTVTTFSKLIALFLFILLPFAGFYAGLEYQEKYGSNINQKACTLEAKICPDGSSVGRTGPNCEFATCPVSSISPIIEQSADTPAWKDYIGSDNNLSLKHPTSWILKSDSSESGEMITLSNQNKSIEIYRPFASGPSECGFSDTEYLGQGANYSQFVDVNLGSRPARRALDDPGKYTICQKEKTSAYFVNLTEFGYIQFKTPSDISDSEIAEMDQILSTFKFTDTNPTPTCMKRPACLDSSPRCMIAEPANGWCP